MSVALPSDEQRQRAKWDLLLLDIEHRTEQVRQLKSYQPWRVIFSGLTTGPQFSAPGLPLDIGFWGHDPSQADRGKLARSRNAKLQQCKSAAPA